ncbi:DUF4360 domain-containing protein [Pseudobacteriovorax antillogorgiicola]|uniref:DUF4360 domain-containing protein n=1 Tax=Pseudobacteriovorax antillogorgiicola TaxID=1513793 RepID=A0A1Y6CFC6_9BACT|nr:DUF4360 domain-containing protein [Pseudobacteriovorax antillogorgiicola]TCS47589.1 uncharacterized protein DUF4360 [Pseudobacteriovorax antillogorgiicola]SMF60256.1 protein of unknown function [Pseudobacteriovorax antillogorgiicola]
MNRNLIFLSIVWIISTLAGATPSTEVASIVANGSGCPMNDPRFNVNGDTILINTEPLEIFISGDDRFDRQNCQVTLNIAPAAGWYYVVEQIQATGYAHVGQGVEGSARLAAYIQGQGFGPTVEQRFQGYTQQSFRLQSSEAIRSSCDEDRALNINTAIRLLNRNSSRYGWGYLTANSQTSVRIRWQRCT